MNDFLTFTSGVFNIVSYFLMHEPVIYFVGLAIILVIALIIKKIIPKGV